MRRSSGSKPDPWLVRPFFCLNRHIAVYSNTFRARLPASPSQSNRVRFASSPEGGATGESVVAALDEQGFLILGTAGLRCLDSRQFDKSSLFKHCPAAATHSDRARRLAPNWAHANSRVCPACQGLPLRGSWHRAAMTERVIPQTGCWPHPERPCWPGP